MKTHTYFLLILKDSSKGNCEATGSSLGERPGKAWLEETGLRLLSGIIWLRQAISGNKASCSQLAWTKQG